MKVYICAPTSGDCLDMGVEIKKIERDLIKAGYEPVSPLRECMSYADFVGSCISDLLKCKAIYLAKEWHSSKRCTCEYEMAKAHGLKTMFGPEKIEALQKYTIPHYYDKQED